MACPWARDPFSRTQGGADVPFSPSRLQRQNLLEFELEASQRHLQRATQSSGGRDLGSLASSMLSWLERQQGCHWGLTTLRDGVISSPVPAGSQAIHSCQEVLETWTYVIFLLIYFPLLALALIQVAQGKGCHRGRQRKGQSFPGFFSSKASPFRGMERPPGTLSIPLKGEASWAPTTPPDEQGIPRAAGRRRVSIDTPRRYMWAQFQATTMKWVTWIFWFPNAYKSYVYTTL